MERSFEMLIKIWNTANLVSNGYWRDVFHDELALAWGVIHGHVDDLTEKGWILIEGLYDDLMKSTPLTMVNPNNLPVLT